MAYLENRYLSWFVLHWNKNAGQEYESEIIFQCKPSQIVPVEHMGSNCKKKKMTEQAQRIWDGSWTAM